MKKVIQAIKIGNTVNVSINGKLHKKQFTSNDESKEFYIKVLDAKENPTDENITQLLSFLNDKLRVAMKCGLESNPYTGEVFLKDYNTPMPNDLVEVYKEYYNNKFPIESLHNFWQLLMLNEDTRNRINAFNFIKKHDFVVTNKGYMVVYKAVYVKQDVSHSNLRDIVTDYYNRVKSWKKSPKNYVVYESTIKSEFLFTLKKSYNKWKKENKKNVRSIGNLKNLYESLTKGKKETIYTDMYSKKMTIKLGVPVVMERGSCNADPAVDCSYGLHVGATKYVENFANKDSVILVCLVNPANIVAIPDYDHSKMRVSEYFPFAVAERNEDGSIEIIKEPFSEDDYITYEEKELQKLLNKVKQEKPIRETPMNGTIETRDWAELQRIISDRLIDIS